MNKLDRMYQWQLRHHQWFAAGVARSWYGRRSNPAFTAYLTMDNVISIEALREIARQRRPVVNDARMVGLAFKAVVEDVEIYSPLYMPIGGREYSKAYNEEEIMMNLRDFLTLIWRRSSDAATLVHKVIEGFVALPIASSDKALIIARMAMGMDRGCDLSVALSSYNYPKSFTSVEMFESCFGP